MGWQVSCRAEAVCPHAHCPGGRSVTPRGGGPGNGHTKKELQQLRTKHRMQEALAWKSAAMSLLGWCMVAETMHLGWAPSIAWFNVILWRMLMLLCYAVLSWCL